MVTTIDNGFVHRSSLIWIVDMSCTRRRFLKSGAVLAGAVVAPHAVHAAQDAKRFTIGLSQYSLRALLRDSSLDLLDYPQFSVDTFGISTLDLWEGGLPLMDQKGYLDKLRRRAEQANAKLFLLMTGALDAALAQRESSLQSILPSLGRAQILGCQFVRVFLKAPGRDQAVGAAACVEALKPLADAAADKDLIVAIEPGASRLSQQGRFLADVARRLNHPACGLMPDFGKQKNNVYAGTEAMMPMTATISCKMHSFDKDGNQPDFDYQRLMRIIAASDYRGILAIEWEGRNLDPVAGVNASQELLKRSIASVKR